MAGESKFITKKKPEYITKKDEEKTPFITKKKGVTEKKKFNLDDIVSKAMNKEDKPQYITKKKKNFITKKSPEEIQDRERMKRASGGRIMYKSGMRVCKLAKKGKGKAYGKNS